MIENERFASAFVSVLEKPCLAPGFFAWGTEMRQWRRPTQSPATPRRFDGLAKALATTRGLGVPSIFATCDCGRSAAVDVSALPDAVPVPALRWRLRWSACGARLNNVRPNWRERVKAAKGMGR